MCHDKISGGYLFNPLESQTDVATVSKRLKSVQGHEWYSNWSASVWMDVVTSAGKNALGWLLDKTSISRRIESSTLFSAEFSTPETPQDEKLNGRLNMKIFFQSTNSLFGAVLRQVPKLRIPLNSTVVEDTPLGTFIATFPDYRGGEGAVDEAHIRFLVLDKKGTPFCAFEMHMVESSRLKGARQLVDMGCFHTPHSSGEESVPFFYQCVFDKKEVR
eukprot:CAMPEP_0179417058 /NCGR_PEP_ID=MMETSP0799-20121207/7144_1 /TAXON_ID=46947 /ORGANISM="Geminigera cryophila, Strain CCMP2564" /LENGTH=216 /DNA_ID=CAMNT_0021190001 /DNA_START=1 /DNA_END=651 /DNA_ORIENTATION=+